MTYLLKTPIFALIVVLTVLTGLLIFGISFPNSTTTRCEYCTSDDILMNRSNKGKDEYDTIAFRLAKVDEICSKYRDALFTNDSNDNRTYSHFPNQSKGMCSLHLVPSLHLGYCPVPKAASSSLKALILRAEHIKDPGDNANEISASFDRHPSVAASKYWRKRLGPEYLMAIVVRHPFERLVSAYVDRVRTTEPWIQGAKKLYRNGFIGSGPNGTFTFGEFVTNILKDPVETWDVHWAPHTHRCRPCSVRYDVIVKVETLEKDLEELLPRLGLAGWMFPRRNAKSSLNKSKARKTFEQHFSELTREQVLRLFAIYVYDFEMYGYKLKGYTQPVL